MCRKTAYETRWIADREARRYGRLNGHPMRSYVCRNCGMHHLTSEGRDGRPGRKVLHWRNAPMSSVEAQVSYGHFTMRPQGDGTWRVKLPGYEDWSEPFSCRDSARRFCEILHTMPRERWEELQEVPR